MGFREQQQAKTKQRVLEVSQQWIAEGKYPRPYDMAHLARTTSDTAEKYQQELIEEGLLQIPEGLCSVAVGSGRFSQPLTSKPVYQPKPKKKPKSDPAVLAASRAYRAKRAIQSYSQRRQMIKDLKERKQSRLETIKEIYQQRKEGKENKD